MANGASHASGTAWENPIHAYGNPVGDRRQIRRKPVGWTQDKGHSMTRRQCERCAKTYDDAVFSMNAHFQCDFPVNDGLTGRDFAARMFLPSASLIPANALQMSCAAVGELPSDPPVVDASNVFDK